MMALLPGPKFNDPTVAYAEASRLYQALPEELLPEARKFLGLPGPSAYSIGNIRWSLDDWVNLKQRDLLDALSIAALCAGCIDDPSYQRLRQQVSVVLSFANCYVSSCYRHTGTHAVCAADVAPRPKMKGYAHEVGKFPHLNARPRLLNALLPFAKMAHDLGAQVFVENNHLHIHDRKAIGLDAKFDPKVALWAKMDTPSGYSWDPVAARTARRAKEFGWVAPVTTSLLAMLEAQEGSTFPRKEVLELAQLKSSLTESGGPEVGCVFSRRLGRLVTAKANAGETAGQAIRRVNRAHAETGGPRVGQVHSERLGHMIDVRAKKGESPEEAKIRVSTSHQK